MKRETIASITPTLAALMGAEAPRLSEALPIGKLLSGAAEAGIARLERCLVYSPDAVGTAAIDENPDLFSPVREAAPDEVKLLSVFPPKTPVCFASMFTGAPPEVHGIREYVKRELECDTLFDALIRAGRRIAIATVRESSMEALFTGRPIELFPEASDSDVTACALELIRSGRHDLILAYHQDYDDMLHEKDLRSPEALEALARHAAAFAELARACDAGWRGHARLVLFAPDHGAHFDAVAGTGGHWENIPEDMEVTHFAGFAKAAIEHQS